MAAHDHGDAPGARPAPAGATAAQFQQGVAHHQRGQLREAEALYRAVLARAPAHFDALHLLGLALTQRGELAAAVDSIRAAIAAEPGNPNQAAALSNLGIALQQLGRSAESLASFDRALALAPNSAGTHYNRGNVLMALQRADEALVSFDRALALEPGHPLAHNNRGNALLALQRPAEALRSFDAALASRPDFADAHCNRATALLSLARPAEALACCERALALAPGLAEALNARGNALRALKRYDEAARSFAELAGRARGFDHAAADVLDCRLRSCDWAGVAEDAKRIEAAVLDGRRAALPWPFLAISGSPAAQLACARTFVAEKYPAAPSPLWPGERHAHERIRVAYLSADFHEHATAQLMAGLFERHDRDRFETTAISFGPDFRDAMRERLARAFDRFVDVRDSSDRAVAQLIREQEIDIAVDLKGYTANGRPGILAFRPAPVQVGYLGYPGTMGAPCIDYVVADRHVIPPGHDVHYTEKVVRLPGSYQVNDAARRIAVPGPTRTEAGLPEAGFVFCCFNSSYKITPDVFGVWMRLVAAVPGSVLWLLETNTTASYNLRREAQQRGVAPERLVFAPELPPDRHLARHGLADLFLDTLPVNAHTTASDALWAGLPLVTCTGQAFAGRVATSLLHAAGLPELVTGSLRDYEALALRLATTPARLTELHERLARNRATCALFDTDRTRRCLESAYVAMWERHRRGEAPAAFDVEAVP